MAVRGRELIAVIGQTDEGPLTWVTTYGRDPKSNHYCALPYEALAVMT